RIQGEDGTQSAASIANGSLVVVCFSVHVTIEGALKPRFERLKGNRKDDGNQDCLREGDAVFVVAGHTLQKFDENYEDGGADDDGADVDDTLPEDDANVHQAISDDGV